MKCTIYTIGDSFQSFEFSGKGGLNEYKKFMTYREKDPQWLEILAPNQPKRTAKELIIKRDEGVVYIVYDILKEYLIVKEWELQSTQIIFEPLKQPIQHTIQTYIKLK